MRVVIASDLHSPTINGIATFGRNLAQGLAEAGHEVTVLAPSQTGKPYEETDGNHRVVRLRSVVFPFYQNLRMSILPTQEILRVLKDFRPDVIHVQTPLGIGLSTISAAEQCGIPVVATNHSMSENFIDNLRLLRPLAKPLDRIARDYGAWFHSKAIHVTLPTQAAIDMLRPGDFRKPTTAISNGIDLSRFHPGPEPEGIRKRFGIPAEVPVVLYVGRLDVEKHLHVLVEAARLMKDDLPFHLVIVGMGIDRNRLERLVNEAGLRDQVTFTGRIEEEDKPGLIRTGRVFAMPSPAELQSISTLEAMASGLPVVAVEAGALPELCHEGVNGRRFALDDAKGMHDGLVSVLSDGEQAERMGAASIEIARRHDLRETIRRFVALYEDVVEEYAASTALAGEPYIASEQN